MNQTKAIVIPSAMRLAFESAWANAERPHSRLGRLVKGALNRRLGVKYRKRMVSVERGKDRV